MLQQQTAYYPAPLLSSRLDKAERQRLTIQNHLALQAPEKRAGFDNAIEAIMTDTTLESTAKLLLITIAQMNRINRYKVSFGRIQRRTGYSHRTISRYLSVLEQRDILEITRGPGAINRYAIMIPERYSA